jgi:hypothetical protein
MRDKSDLKKKDDDLDIKETVPTQTYDENEFGRE